jgi:hypothetical protein
MFMDVKFDNALGWRESRLVSLHFMSVMWQCLSKCLVGRRDMIINIASLRYGSLLFLSIKELPVIRNGYS